MSEQIAEIAEANLPNNIKSLWLKALSALELKNYSYAISLCNAVSKESPGFLEARELARKCAFLSGAGRAKKGGLFSSSFSSSKIQSQAKKDLRGALCTIEEQLGKSPSDPILNDLLFDVAVKLNLNATAAFALETVRKASPENTKLLHKLAEYYLALDEPQNAADVYADIVKLDPSDIDAVKGNKDAEARATMKKGGWEKGGGLDDVKKDAEKAVEMEKNAKKALTRDELEARLNTLLERYQQDNHNMNTCKDLARTYEDLEHWQDAYTFYNWTYELSNKDITLRNKAEQMKTRAEEEEMKSLEAQLVAEPDNEELKNHIAQLKQERALVSIAQAEQRVERNPTDPELRFNLGSAYFAAGQFNEAIPHLQQAKRNPHIRTRVLLTLGRAFDAKGMHDIAIKQFEDALEDLSVMDATKKEVLYEMGQVYSKMGDQAKAIASYKEIYEVDYGYLDVAQLVEQSYRS